MAGKCGMRIEFTVTQHRQLRIAAALRGKPIKHFVQDAVIAATKRALTKRNK